MAGDLIPGVDITKLTGPMVLGYMWSYFLYGILIVQLYMYTEMFPNDRGAIKTLVWTMFFFDTAFTIMMTAGAWDMLGSGWGDPSRLLQLNWSWGVMPLVSGVLSGMAQGFYIWRIWHLTKKLWLPIPIGLAVLAQLIGLWWFGIQWNIGLWHVAVLPPLSPGVTVWLAGSAVCDVLITMALTFVLWNRKKKTSFAATSGVLNRLIILSIETGALTSITATVEVILWLGWEEFNYHFTLFLCLGKLYSNVLVATLNCRNQVFLTGSKGAVLSGASVSGNGTSTVGPGPGATGTVLAPQQQTAFWSEPTDQRDFNVHVPGGRDHENLKGSDLKSIAPF
ncbi:hypothetical protein K438DRAFT_1827235 [Mycena galopus ATCC 62051]|nr:hypothetical protein K438DRAFT_1827235 [Mycena galopus ATCC 62051]